MNKHPAQQGFTLLELVMVILVVALASVPVLGQFAQVSGSLLANEEIQTAAQLAQERAEGILADRRIQGYAAIATGTTIDALTGSYAAYGRTVTVTEPPSGSGCAVGATCKEVVISTSLGGTPRAELTFILVNY
jgi:prepilin-type N-terminal cleavage/methylation domain-containing protein